MRKSKRARERGKALATRDNWAAMVEFCERHGYVSPLEYFLHVGNGTDPRHGADVAVDTDDLEGGITVADSTRAMAEAAKYIYIPASRLEVQGDIGIEIPPVRVDESVIESLTARLAALGIGGGTCDE